MCNKTGKSFQLFQVGDSSGHMRGVGFRRFDTPHPKLRYDYAMRRLLQVGTLLFLLVTFLAPTLEWFDRWDASGLGNDSEFAIFVLVFALCLVLVVMKLLSALALRITLIRRRVSEVAVACCLRDAAARITIRPPLLANPLRI